MSYVGSGSNCDRRPLNRSRSDSTVADGHSRSVAILPQSRPSRSVSGAFRFKAILALPALSRRPEDHRRHRRACGDCQGYSRTWACLCAPPRSPARPLALFQAALILKAKAVLQCPDDPARPALACSGQTVSKRFGPIQGSNNHREREIFTKHRAIDRLSGRRYSQSRTRKRWFQIPIPWMLRQVQAFRRAEFGAPFHGVRLDEEDGRKSSEKCFARHVRVGIVLDGYVGDVRGRESR